MGVTITVRPILVVDREGDRLFARLGMQDRFEILLQSDAEFFWKAADAQVNFVKGPEGKIVEAIRHQNGGTIRAPRLDELKIVKSAPMLYDALVGSYKQDQGEGIPTVTREGDRLFSRMTGQPKLELLRKFESEFSLREVNAQVTLFKDSNGKVTRAKLLQGDQVTEATKIKQVLSDIGLRLERVRMLLLGSPAALQTHERNCLFAESGPVCPEPGHVANPTV